MNKHKYYGQNGEDFLLWEILGDKTDGFFIDIGAFDGIHLSNSYSFELEGWDGICVEAHPEYFQLLEKNRSNSKNIHAACIESNLTHEISFLSEPLGLLSGIEAYKTEGMERRYSNRGMKFPGFNQITVPAKTITKILDDLGAPSSIDFLTLDTEGTELKILQGLDLKKYDIRIILVEANTQEEFNELREFLEPFGYFLAKELKYNYFFSNQKDDVDLLQDAQVVCTIEDTLHPLGIQATHPAMRGRDIKILPEES